MSIPFYYNMFVTPGRVNTVESPLIPFHATPDRRNYQKFLTYNFSLSEWSFFIRLSFGCTSDRGDILTRSLTANIKQTTEEATSFTKAVVSRSTNTSSSHAVVPCFDTLSNRQYLPNESVSVRDVAM